MKKYLTAGGVAGSIAFLPMVALAQFGKLDAAFNDFIEFINFTLVPLIFALAFLLFLWGMFKYFFWGGGEEEKREEGKQLMLWAIIAFLLMVSIWGIVNVLSGGFGFDDPDLINIPNAPGQRI